MSPLILILGLLAVGILADDAKLPQLNEQAKQINFLAHQQEQEQFWWEGDDSPLGKAAESYKKTDEDLSGNPFLNGQYSENAGKSTAHLTGDEPEKIDLSNNPFFNGGIQSGFVHAGNGEVVDDSNGFLGVQPSRFFFPKTPQGHEQEQSAAPEKDNRPLNEGYSSTDEKQIECSGPGKICVKKHECTNGYISNDGFGLIQVRTQVSYCNPDTETCCKYKTHTEDHITAGKSSVGESDAKLTGHVLNEPKLLISNLGETGADINKLGPSTPKSARDAHFSGSTIDYSNVKFDDAVRFASTIRGPAYLPPIDGTTPKPTTYKPLVPSPSGPSCGPNEIRQGGQCVAKCYGNQQLINGRCQSPPSPPSPPPTQQCGPNEVRQGNQCVPKCYGNQQLVNGRCQSPPSPSSPPTPPKCYGNQQLINGRCQSPPSPPSPPSQQCFGNQQLINGRCQSPPSPPSPPSPQCYGNQQLINGRCQSPPSPPSPPTPPKCYGNQQLINGRCQSPPSPPSPQCYGNQQLINGRCQSPPSSPSPPPQQCYGNQQLINGRCQSPPSPPSPPSPQCYGNQQLINGRCQSPPSPPSPPTPPKCYGNQQLINGRCQSPPSPPSPPSPQCYGNQQLINGRCQSPPSPPSPPGPPKCYGNQQLINGRCQSPPPPQPPRCSPTQDLVNGVCVQRPPPPTNGDGYLPPQKCAYNEDLVNGRCVAKPPQCGFNEQLVNGRCVSRPPPPPQCGPNEQLINGRCVGKPAPPPQCGFNEQLINGRCVSRPPPPPQCGPNEQLVNGRCVSRPPPPPQCGPNEQLVNGRCVSRPPPPPQCGPNEQLVNGRCVGRPAPPPQCGYNEQLINGRCVSRPTPPPQCGPNEQLVNGRCVSRPPPPPQCGPNEQLVNGRCVSRPPPPPQCGPNEQLVNGRCVGRPAPPPQCGYNEQLINGRCVPRPPPPPQCGPNEQLVNGRCIGRPAPPPQCGPNEQLINGRCVGRPAPPPQCGQNEQTINGRCVPRPPLPPACRPNEQLVNGRCVSRPQPPQCGYNQQLVNGRCEPKETVPEPVVVCPPYQQNINGRCVTRPTPPPTSTVTGYLPPLNCGPNEVIQNGVCSRCTGNTQYQNGRCVPNIPTSTNGYTYTTPTPIFTLPSSTPGSEYVPPYDGDGSSINNVLVSTTTTTTSTVPTRFTSSTYNPDYTPTPTNNKDVIVPSGCAAALKCVKEIHCTAEGFVSPVPVIFTKDQELSKVPLTDCFDAASGTPGKCCRDPDYKDPWPSANLVNGIDNGQYREDPGLGQYGQEKNRLTRSYGQVSNYHPQEPTCGERHFDTQPRGPGALDAHFAEIPWQAMILRDSNRSLLCGGTILKRNVVLTSAHCVEGLEAHDVLIKGGEWKLGIDEEPLPFQIVGVKKILVHPAYNRDYKHADLALLILDDNLRMTKNVGSICLPKPNEQPVGNCIATGWGKKILQIHLKGAIMRTVDINLIGQEQCYNHLQANFPEAAQQMATTTICGTSQADQCKVDHGSALACTTDGIHYTLAGVFSWDTGCKNENQVGGYVLPDIEWIENTIAGNQ